MTKAKKKEESKITDVLELYIKVPEHIRHMVKNPDNMFSVRLNADKLALSRTIANALIVARGLPADPETTAIVDDVTVYIQRKQPWLSGSEAREAAVHYYETQHVEAGSNAMMVAFTDENDLLIPATPYQDRKEEDTVPAWRKDLAILEVPPPAKNLSNPYEARYKAVIDFLQEGGAVFANQVIIAVNDGMGKTVLLLDEDTDDAGFPPKPSGSKVHVPSVPEDAD